MIKKVLMLLIIATSLYAQKFTNYVADGSPDSDDLMIFLDVGGAKDTTKKITWDEMEGSLVPESVSDPNIAYRNQDNTFTGTNAFDGSLTTFYNDVVVNDGFTMGTIAFGTTLEFRNTPVDAFNILNCNVGIGTGAFAPDERLEIFGRIHLNQTTAPGVTADKLYNVGGTLYWAGTDITSGGFADSAGVSNYADSAGVVDISAINYWTKSGNNLYYTGAFAKVGIGTASPFTRLDIAGASLSGYSPDAGTDLTIDDGGGAIISLLGGNTTTQGLWFGKPGNAGRGLFEYANIVDAFVWGTAGIPNRMYLSSEGKLGIGTNSPDSTLHVAGSVQIDDHLQVDGLINGVKEYVAILSQTGTSAPVVEELLKNTLGFTPSWSRSNVGIYGFNGIPSAGVACYDGGADNGSLEIRNVGGGSLLIRTRNYAGSLADGILEYTSIKIEIYP